MEAHGRDGKWQANKYRLSKSAAGFRMAKTRAEHDVLLHAIHRLEAALGRPAPGREDEWARKVSTDLEQVSKALQLHITSSEHSDGLFSELDLARPTISHRVEQLRSEHVGLTLSLHKLSRTLAEGDQSRDYEALRKQGAALLTELRQHHASEVDLIFEVFWTDLGVGD